VTFTTNYRRGNGGTDAMAHKPLTRKERIGTVIGLVTVTLIVSGFHARQQARAEEQRLRSVPWHETVDDELCSGVRLRTDRSLVLQRAPGAELPLESQPLGPVRDRG
jgi:hypothetical protein